MVQLRRNYQKQGGGGMVRLVIFAILLVGFSMGWGWFTNDSPSTSKIIVDSDLEAPLDELTDQIIHHQFYSLGYNEDSEQPSWVAYELTREQLNKKRVKRTDYFSEDTEVLTQSSHHRDYIRSGYSRGHMVPAADRAFSSEAMEETFLMSNICPQKAACNGGVWRELEENVRDWARKYESLYIFSGPILYQLEGQRIGKTSSVEVPDHFYKVLLNPKMEAIGFIIPNDLSTRPLQDFMVTVDEVERKTGIDFLKDMVPGSSEEKVESRVNKDSWKVDERRYQKRLNDWNHR